MNERIKELTVLTLDGKMHPQENKFTDFDPNYIFLPDHEKAAKRTYDYIMAQEPVLTELNTLTGLLSLNGGIIEGDYMHCEGFKNICELMNGFYCKPVENLSTMEWQHATADYNSVIRIGIKGLIEKINISRQKFCDNAEKLDFLNSLEIVAKALTDWAHKCSRCAYELSERTENGEYRRNLARLSKALERVPENPAENFYEAVLSVVLLFGYDPDSLGTLDRTLSDFYYGDIENGSLTREEAKNILQELFLIIQSNTSHMSGNFTRGGESHFCVGGYNEKGEDIFDDFSMLILEALTDLPTFIPQVSLRWTKKLPFETFYKILKMSVEDQNKRIAFINDEVKIHAATHIAQIPFDVACKYTSVGCNEVAYPGCAFMGTTNTNILRSVENTFKYRTEEISRAESFEEFFEIYKEELFRDIDKMLEYENKFMSIRAKDTSYVTSLLFTDCIENAESFTRGACKYAVAGFGMIGIPNVIDSLTAIKQFVYDTKAFSMRTLAEALKNDWNGFEDMRMLIVNRCEFFGNDSDISNYTAALFADTVYEYTKDKTSLHGYHYIFGNLQGYNPHHEWFGSRTAATPDGRHSGEALKFGLGQGGGYDRNGISSLLKSVAVCDRHGIITGGPSVTNINLDTQLVKNEANLQKTARLLEAYFLNGGSQFQLNYVSPEELKAAKVTPTEYKALRVRVSGFSDFFVRLDSATQDDIIARTVAK